MLLLKSNSKVVAGDCVDDRAGRNYPQIREISRSCQGQRNS